jgi:hypothetical protein
MDFVAFGKLVEFCCAGRLDVDPAFVSSEWKFSDDHFAHAGSGKNLVEIQWPSIAMGI